MKQHEQQRTIAGNLSLKVISIWETLIRVAVFSSLRLSTPRRELFETAQPPVRSSLALADCED